MKIISISFVLLMGLALTACKSGGPESPAFTKRVEVFGLYIYATNTLPDIKLLHAANVWAQYIDNDEDGIPDNQRVMDVLMERGTSIVMAINEEEREAIPREEKPRGQGLYGRETFPNAIEEGVFDVTLEEVLHPYTRGYALAYPEIFGFKQGTAVGMAVDSARGGYFEEVPEKYPDGAWYTYYDETCSYGCMCNEYIYWALTSILGSQDIPGRQERIGDEWPLNTKELVMETDKAIYELLTNPEYKLPTIIPDGHYSVKDFEVEEYIWVEENKPALGDARTDMEDHAGMIAKIREEGYKNSEVMDIAWNLTDVYGPRLANSPSYNEAANWAEEKFIEFGAENVALQSFTGAGGMP